MIDTITNTEMEKIEKTLETALNYVWDSYGNFNKPSYDLKRAYDEGFGVINGFQHALKLCYSEEITERVFEEIIENLWRDYTDKYYEELFAD